MSYGMDGWNKSSGDLISRAEAIDDLHGKDPSQIWDTADIEVWVNALPSAQPEIVRCKDCKHRYIDGENVRYNVCDLNHNKVQGDYWYCADGERKDDE